MIQGETDEQPAQLIYCCTLYSGPAHQFTISAPTGPNGSSKLNYGKFPFMNPHFHNEWMVMRRFEDLVSCRDENINKTAPGDLILGSYCYHSHPRHPSYPTHRCYRYINLPPDRFAGIRLHPRLDITGVATWDCTWYLVYVTSSIYWILIWYCPDISVCTLSVWVTSDLISIWTFCLIL